MPYNIGVEFEHKFKEDWKKSFKNSLCFKIYNQMSGYKTVNNYCDYICYDGERMYMIDCKSCKGASFPFSDFPQYERLIGLKNVRNLITGVVLWLYEKDSVWFIPTFTFEKAKKNKLKSINPKTIDRSVYYIVNIPSVKLRTYMNSDYSVLKEVPDYYKYIESNKENNRDTVKK